MSPDTRTDEPISPFEAAAPTAGAPDLELEDDVWVDEAEWEDEANWAELKLGDETSTDAIGVDPQETDDPVDDEHARFDEYDGFDAGGDFEIADEVDPVEHENGAGDWLDTEAPYDDYLLDEEDEVSPFAPAGVRSTTDGMLDREAEAFLSNLWDSASALWEKALVNVAIARGERNPNRLTDLVFQRRHPKRSGRPLDRRNPDDRSLIAQWLQIRDTIVRPALASTRPAQPSGSGPAATGARRRPRPAAGGHNWRLSGPVWPLWPNRSTASGTGVRSRRTIDGVGSASRSTGRRRPDAGDRKTRRLGRGSEVGAWPGQGPGVRCSSAGPSPRLASGPNYSKVEATIRTTWSISCAWQLGHPIIRSPSLHRTRFLCGKAT